MEFDYERIMKPHTVVHCDTEEKANELLKWADSKGLKWCSDQSYLDENNWDVFKKLTWYNLYSGIYCNIHSCWKPKDPTILKYEDVILHEKVSKTDLEKLYQLRTEELAISLGIDCRYTKTTSYNELESNTLILDNISEEVLRKDKKYLEYVLAVNKEVRNFPNWTTGKNQLVIDFSNRISLSIGGIALGQHISRINTELEKRKLVEVPENLKHLIKQL